MAITRPKFATIDEYIVACREEVQGTLQELRQTIHEAAPDAIEAIKYGIPTFVLHGNLIHFAAYQHHIGIYPIPSARERTMDEVLKYQTGKGTLQFPLSEPLPLPLIRQIVAFRVQEALAKKARGRKAGRKAE